MNVNDFLKEVSPLYMYTLIGRPETNFRLTHKINLKKVTSIDDRGSIEFLLSGLSLNEARDIAQSQGIPFLAHFMDVDLTAVYNRTPPTYGSGGAIINTTKVADIIYK